MNYSNFIDSDMLMDISDYKGLDDIKEAYKEIDKKSGICSGKRNLRCHTLQMQQNSLQQGNVRRTWMGKIQLHGMNSLEPVSEDTECRDGGFKRYMDLSCTVECSCGRSCTTDVCAQVNHGKTTFSKEYKKKWQERMLELLPYGPDDPLHMITTGACTAFAKGESAMYTIGSYAIPQIQTVNPDMEIDSFVMPASNNKKEENKLNSGIDLQFCVMQDCKNKEAAYEVLDFLLEDENVQAYLDAQKAVPCKEGDFELPSTLEGMKEYIKKEKCLTIQDHYYPSEIIDTESRHS